MNYWTERQIEWEVYRLAVTTQGWFPLRKQMPMSLGEAVTRKGGVTYWSQRLGLPLQQQAKCADFGAKWEFAAAAVLTEAGIRCEVMHRKHPFDIQTDRGVRINVKASRRHEYGHIFWLGSTPRVCDVVCLVQLAEDETPTYLWVPASLCTMKSLTITEAGVHRFLAMTTLDAVHAAGA